MQNRYDELRTILDELLLKSDRVIVAIDGNCAAGKTTLGNMLLGDYDCSVFHMDDFFLLPEMRTPERLSESGGNVDYERFLEEVLKPLKEGRKVTYRPYNCHTGNFEKPIKPAQKKLNIVEGSYSLNRHLRDYYNFCVFLSVSEELQRKRILKRNPNMAERFFNEWIPLENRYINGDGIKEKCQLVIDCDKLSKGE